MQEITLPQIDQEDCKMNEFITKIMAVQNKFSRKYKHIDNEVHSTYPWTKTTLRINRPKICAVSKWKNLSPR